MWNDAVVTNEGKELLAQWLNGGALSIDSAATGQGTVAASLLMGQTALVSKKQDMSIVRSEKIEGGMRFQLQLTSEGVSNSYTINQIGLWGSLNGGQSKLIALYQDATGNSVPTHAEMPDFVFTFWATIQMSNTGELVANIDTSAIVTRSDFNTHLADKDNPHDVTQKQLFSALTETQTLAAGDFIPVGSADGTGANKITKENLHKALGLNTTSIVGATITLGAAQTYSGTVKTQAVSSVVVGGKTLTAGTDYIVSGNTGTNAGNYTLVITGIGAYVGSVAKSWTIAKAAGSASANQTNVSIVGASGATKTVTITRSGDGTVIATSSDPSVVDVTVSGTTLTLTASSSGSAVITVAVGAGTNHQAASCKISVSTTIFSSVLNDNTWAKIGQASDANVGASLWPVGATKAVPMNGTVGTLELNTTLWVYILGFNHNAAKEGNGKIHFGGFKTAQSGGTDVALVDSRYGSRVSDGTKLFNMNHSANTNVGGWKDCDMRYDILGSTHAKGENAATTTATSPVSGTLMAALPADLRAVMKPITKYTDNVGNATATAECVTATVDYLPLLAEFEIFGARTRANQYEQNHQAQYTYYANGNSKIKYKHNDPSSAANVWERSPYYNYATFFCGVNGSGGAVYYYADGVYAVSPAFAV